MEQEQILRWIEQITKEFSLQVDGRTGKVPTTLSDHANKPGDRAGADSWDF